MTRFKIFSSLFLPVLILMAILAGNAQAALLDFGPIVPEVVGSTPPNIRAGFPAWFRDTNRIPLQLCLEEVPGCLFAAVDRPDLTQPLAFPNLPDELFYYSATATIGDQLLFAGVEMNFFDNGDGTYEQVGFSRVRIRISTTIAGRYTVTTPWKQYFFDVTPADLIATPDGRRIINATEDIGLRADGDFAGVLLGNIGPYVYSQGAPFGIAPNLYLGDNTPRTVLGSTFPDPSNPGQMANIFRIEGPNGFTTVSTDQFAITGKLFLDPIPTPLTVDKLTYARDTAGVQVNAFATSQPFSNQNVGGTAIPGRFALTGAPSTLQVSGTGIPTRNMTTNNPADGEFFSTTGRFAFNGTLPANATVTNTADTPATVKTVPLVDEIKITNATFNPTTRVLTINAQSLDTIATNNALSAFMPGMTTALGTLANGLLSVTFPVTDNSVQPSKTYNIPTEAITVTSAIGGAVTAPVITFLPVQPAAATGVTIASTLPSPQAPGAAVNFIANGVGGSGTYEYRFSLNTGGVWTVVQNYSTSANWAWNTTGLATGSYFVQVDARSVGSTAAPASRVIAYNLANTAPAATAVTLAPIPASPQNPGAAVAFVAAASGGSGSYEYRFWLKTGAVWAVVQNYSSAGTWNWNTTGLAPGTYSVQVDARNAGTTNAPAVKVINFSLVAPPPPATAVTLASTLASPQTAGASVSFVAAGSGGSGNYQYRFWLNTGGVWAIVQNYGSSAIWTWNTTGVAPGQYFIQTDVRNVGSTAIREAASVKPFTIQ